MRTKTRLSRFRLDSMSPSRPVRAPSEREARWAMARDLARGQWGVDEPQALGIAHLPLMDVALDGVAGMDIAEARDWRRAA